MPNKIVFSGSVIRPDRILKDGFVACRDGRIEHIGSGRPPSEYNSYEAVEGHLIAPGYIDIHVHGAANSDYMDGEATAVIAVNREHAKHGTAVIFPTTTTGTREELTRMIDAVARVQEEWSPGDGSRIAGVHFYGPYFAEDKVGCHPVEGRRDPVKEEYEFFLHKDIVRIATCAAELKGAADFYRCSAQAGCLTTCGHSNASWSEIDAGFNDGVRHVDHFWSAMSSVPSLRKRFGTPMQASMEQYVLWNKNMSTEVIADGEHLSDELLMFAYEMIGSHRLCLVTDANRAMGCPPGKYRFGNKDTGSWVVSDGLTVRGEDGGLASSMCGMDQMVQVMARATGAPINTVINMASLTPATLTGISSDHGSLECGKIADVLMLSDNLEVEALYLAGQRFE